MLVYAASRTLHFDGWVLFVILSHPGVRIKIENIRRLYFL